MRRSFCLEANSRKAQKERDFLQKVEEQSEDGLMVIDAGEKGRGVAAAKSFSTGDFVTCYKGEVISHKDALARYINKANTYKSHARHNISEST